MWLQYCDFLYTVIENTIIRHPNIAIVFEFIVTVAIAFVLLYNWTVVCIICFSRKGEL